MRSIQTVRRTTSDEVALAARDWFVQRVKESIQERGKCVVALAGGSTPKRLYQLLAELEEGVIDWPKVHLFWGDERNVPQDHVESNYRMVEESLLNRLNGSRPVVHRIRTGEKTADDAARAYEFHMREFTRGAPFHFDIVLLGLGDDAHTASLFPETLALAITDRWVVANQVQKLSTTRVTLTAPILNEARHVAFLVCGASKQWAIDRVRGPKNPYLYPAQLIEPAGELWWFVDESLKV